MLGDRNPLSSHRSSPARRESVRSMSSFIGRTTLCVAAAFVALVAATQADADAVRARLNPIDALRHE